MTATTVKRVKRVPHLKTPEEYIELIDRKYNEAKKSGLHRLDPKWGGWSAEMNRETRAYQKENPTEELSAYYQKVFEYWTVVSQLLDLHYKRKVHHIYKKALITRKAKEKKRLRDMIVNKRLKDLPKYDAIGRPKV